MSFETIDSGRIRVTKEFVPLLRASDLDTFEKVMAFSEGRTVRDFPGRRTVHFELPKRNGETQGIYLKRYGSDYLSATRRVLRWIRWPGAEDEALREWEMIHALRQLGISTATPIAVGQESADRGSRRSFLMTAEIAGAMEGDTYFKTLSEPERRRRFLLRVADLTKHFHENGFVHKDYYISHVLVVGGAGEPDLYLIDLQRVMKPCCFSRRWVAKDLGELVYSALKAGARRPELLRFYLRYSGKQELGAKEKRNARRVLRRVAWLRTRRPRHDVDFQQLE
jgi:hypothetical protein